MQWRSQDFLVRKLFSVEGRFRTAFLFEGLRRGVSPFPLDTPPLWEVFEYLRFLKCDSFLHIGQILRAVAEHL